MTSPYYFDYAAATPIDDVAFAAMQPYWTDQFYNPSATYLVAKNVAKDIAAARAQIAAIIGARPPEIIFTAGGTEADNLAIHGMMQQYPDANLVVSAVEHEAVLKAAECYPHAVAPVDETGHVDTGSFTELIDNNTVLVSIMHANNEVGAIQPLVTIKKQIMTIRHERILKGNTLPLYLHTDASQTANYLDIHAHRLGVDLMTINGGKIYGPKQTGVLFVGGGIQLKPQIVGGGQERSIRSGTENVPGIIGLAKALEIAQSSRKDEWQRLSKLQQLFIHELYKAIPICIVNSVHALPNFVHVTIPGCDNERLVMELDERGILCAMGSACSASNDEPSHVLNAMGLSETVARSSLRFTMGRHTTAVAVTDTVKQLAELCG